MVGPTGEIGTEAGEPTTTKEGLFAPDADEWHQPMEDKLHGLRENGSFEDEEPPSNIKPFKTRFVYKLKWAANGEIGRYKARLVSSGFIQRPRVDFFETLGPVIGFDIVRTVLAISAMRAASKVGFRGRSDHVDIELKCTPEYVERGVIELKYVGTKEQMADILTKRLQTPLVTKFVEKVLSK